MKIGELYKVTFHDHSVGLDDTVKCEASGWLIKETEKAYTFTSWQVITTDLSLKEDNLEKFCILKSAIIPKGMQRLSGRTK